MCWLCIITACSVINTLILPSMSLMQLQQSVDLGLQLDHFSNMQWVLCPQIIWMCSNVYYATHLDYDDDGGGSSVSTQSQQKWWEAHDKCHDEAMVMTQQQVHWCLHLQSQPPGWQWLLWIIWLLWPWSPRQLTTRVATIMTNWLTMSDDGSMMNMILTMRSLP